MQRSVKRRSVVPSSKPEISYPAHAFGHRALQYRAFLEALLAGLVEYEVRKGGLTLATTPLPA